MNCESLSGFLAFARLLSPFVQKAKNGKTQKSGFLWYLGLKGIIWNTGKLNLVKQFDANNSLKG